MEWWRRDYDDDPWARYRGLGGEDERNVVDLNLRGGRKNHVVRYHLADFHAKKNISLTTVSRSSYLVKYYLRYTS